MSRSAAFDSTAEAIARSAAEASAPRDSVGQLLEVVAEGKGLTTYYFETKQKGYPGWRWGVTTYQQLKKSPITVSEVVLLPGESALLAPQWVPWSERLAEFRALQEEQSATEDSLADAETEIETEPNAVSGSDVDDVNPGASGQIGEAEADSESEAPAAAAVEDELAVPELEESEQPEQDSVTAGSKKPRLFRRRKRFGKK